MRRFLKRWKIGRKLKFPVREPHIRDGKACEKKECPLYFALLVYLYRYFGKQDYELEVAPGYIRFNDPSTGQQITMVLQSAAVRKVQHLDETFKYFEKTCSYNEAQEKAKKTMKPFVAVARVTEMKAIKKSPPMTEEAKADLKARKERKKRLGIVTPKKINLGRSLAA